MATRVVRKDKPVPRLWVFAPAHRLHGAAKNRLADATVVNYVAQTAIGELQQGEAPIALLPRTSRLEIAFDCTDVFLTTVAAPRLTESKLRQALPNLLEDRLLADAADCHFAFQSGARSGETAPGTPPQLPVAVVDRGLLTRLLDVFAAVGERARTAYSAIYVLPPPSADTLHVRITRGSGVARTALHDGMAFEFDGSHTPATLQLALRQHGWQRIVAYGDGAREFAAMAEASGVAIEVADKPLDPDAPAAAINLLQGAFARGGMMGDLALPRLTLRALRAPLAWACVAGIVFIAGMNGYWLKLEAESRDLRSRMANAFRSAFAEAEMVDPIVQTQRELIKMRARAGQTSASDFTALNAQVAQLLANAPVGIVASIEYRDAALRLKFKSPPDAQLQNQLRAQAVQQGMQLRFDADAGALITATGS